MANTHQSKYYRRFASMKTHSPQRSPFKFVVLENREGRLTFSVKNDQGHEPQADNTWVRLAKNRNVLITVPYMIRERSDPKRIFTVPSSVSMGRIVENDGDKITVQIIKDLDSSRKLKAGDYVGVNTI